MRVSLQNVADRLGLHRSTVSRALRRDPSIPVSTRQTVEQACQALGYRPNSLISELAASRWQGTQVAKGIVIAYLNCMRKDEVIGIRAPLISSLTNQAQLLGYHLETFNRADLGSSSKIQRLLRNRGITDVILGPAYQQDLTVELDWDRFITVQVLPGTYRLPLHTVVQDHFSMMTLAWQKAVDRGYRRIGVALIDHQRGLIDDIIRLSAVYACQNHLHSRLPALPPFLYPPDNARVDDYAKWVRENQPEAIIGFTESHFHYYRSRFDRDIPFASLHTTGNTAISGIVEASAVCGREAVNLLHLCRRTYQWGMPKERIDHVIEPTWFDGTSLPPAPGAGTPGLARAVP